ncbi:MAG: hypothetical protein IPL61_25350 [Myxococcales bacterium]|nr:hypothetical protein [Myxococcales bacterium]
MRPPVLQVPVLGAVHHAAARSARRPVHMGTDDAQRRTEHRTAIAEAGAADARCHRGIEINPTVSGLAAFGGAFTLPPAPHRAARLGPRSPGYTTSAGIGPDAVIWLADRCAHRLCDPLLRRARVARSRLALTDRNGARSRGRGTVATHRGPAPPARGVDRASRGAGGQVTA